MAFVDGTYVSVISFRSEVGEKMRLLTCPIGSSHLDRNKTVNGPLKCFNPSKNWQLGWYKEKSLQIGLGESWRGRLVAFVDFPLADPRNNEFVLLRVNHDLFVQFNRAAKFNVDTSLHPDKVVVVEGGGRPSTPSILKGALGSLEVRSRIGMTIEVCSMSIGDGPLDYAEVSVYPMGSMWTCDLSPSVTRPPLPAPAS